MTVRKEIFVKIKTILEQIPEIELVDLQRKQFSAPQDGAPTYNTAALVELKSMSWGSIMGQKQEGTATVDVVLYVKNGWSGQNGVTNHDDFDLVEIDLHEKIIKRLQSLKGDAFKPIQLTAETAEEAVNEMMCYRLAFTTDVYRDLSLVYTNRLLDNHPVITVT